MTNERKTPDPTDVILDEMADDEPASDEERGAAEPLEPASRRPRGPTARRIYSTGIAALDDSVRDLIDTLASGESLEGPVSSIDLELTRETLTSALRLALQHATRAELKLVNNALKEFAYSFRVFAPYRGLRKVSIFGSARVEEGDHNYMAAREFAREMAARDWMVITGAGPGIMAAGHQGAGAEHSFGANIRLPQLNPANIYIAKDGKLINFKYFFTRKVTFMKESSAFVLLPGGWGTLDEAFELLTLTQTGKSSLHPIVLLEPDGSTFWDAWLQFNQKEVLERHYIHDDDFSLFRIARTPLEAVEEIERFYHNYQSARFVGERLILRLHRAPDAAALERINRDFADLLAQGTFEVIGPLPPEVRDNDHVDAARIAFFPRHDYGRIRQLIDVLNEL